MSPTPLKRWERLALAGMIGLLVCLVSLYTLQLGRDGAGDFRFSLFPARDLLAGRDPYISNKLNLDPLSTAYPLPAFLLALPLAWLPDRAAAVIFFGLSSGLLAWFILRQGQPWRLLIFLSWPFFNSMMFSQWTAYITCMYFTSGFLFLALIKPQMALPFVLLRRPSRPGVLFAAGLLLVSLLVYPTWPLVVLQGARNYAGLPPLFVLPLGPLLLLALCRWREKRAWLLVLLAAMPQRMVYDQLPVLLVAGSPRQMIFLTLCSWISLPVVIRYNGWANVPGGWQLWIVLASYLPALLVTLWPLLQAQIGRLRRTPTP